ncbi:MAG: carboxypeptidase M32, partial [Cyanobium sp.]
MLGLLALRVGPPSASLGAGPPMPPMPTPALERLQAHLHHTRLLGSISSALYYDQNTVMPAAGAPWRGEQLALLAGQLHERQSSAAYAELVGAAEAELGADAAPERRRNLQLLRLELERQRCLDPALVSALAMAQSRGNAIWQDAKAANDFSAFVPALRELIHLRRQQASQLAAAEPVARSPWEVLAQPFEPDISKARLEELFAPLKSQLPPLLQRVVASQPAGSNEAVDLPEALQESLCAELLTSWGYDERRCQRSRSAHPFSCTVGPADFRITTRVVPGQPLSAFL